MEPLLQVHDLGLYFETYGGRVHALNGVDLTLRQGEIMGLVGETGSGKSVTARAILGLLASNAHVTSGTVMFAGEDLLKKSEREMRQVRGREISMVFQDARAALNPVFSVGHQLARVATFHQKLSGKEAQARAIEMLRRVEISEPERRARQYPHELSGGMCQRVMIAMALICSPKLILLDEPTTGLDVTVQAEVIELVQHLVSETGAAALIITHDLGVVAQVCGRVAVMYAGRVVEDGPAQAIFTGALHPYTQALEEAKLDVDDEIGGRILSIPGTVPDLRFLPAGCAYAPRCPLRSVECDEPPPARALAPEHTVRCFHSELLIERRRAAAAGGSSWSNN